MSQPPSSDFAPETARVPRASDAEPLPSASGRHGRRRAVTVAALGCVAAGVMASAFASQAVPATSATRAASPLVPATTHAASAFSADPSSSVPAGLTPNQIVNPLVAPAQPVVLSWTPVAGAVSYDIEVSSSPGFTNIAWSTKTDQPQVAPDVLLSDGRYWWRVTAIDAAGTRGIVSGVATFIKQWSGQVTGGILSGTPGGTAASLVRVTPYLDWNPVPGAAYYQTQIATGDQFASPLFDPGWLSQPGVAPGATTVLPDGGYIWRVRAFDAANDPGPWATESAYTKSWVAPNVTAPADGATISNFELAWDSVPGADSYQVQVTNTEYTFTGSPLVVNATTASTAYVPDLIEKQGAGIGYGQYWFRVRPVVHGITGTWSPVNTFTYQAATGIGTTPTLSSTPSSTSALTPILSWTPVNGAAVYRIDIATDPNFNNIVFQDLTTNTAWAMRSPLPDSAVTGYWWRVVWGSSANSADPLYMVDDTQAPTATFTKQSQPILGTAASGVVSSPPLFTWSDVPGAAKYELQVSRDQQFTDSTTHSMDVYGLGTWWTPTQSAPLTSGTWYWRVRPIDYSGQGLTFSSIGNFTISPPTPSQTAPSPGVKVIASPVLTWTPVNGACSYDVQVSATASFPVTGASAVRANGVRTAASGTSSIPGGANTAQTAYVPTGQLITHPGLWYWHVRAVLCDSDTGPWSATEAFTSELPPQFNLNRIPTQVQYGTRVTVAGQLVANGNPVANPVLIVERRLYPSSVYTPVGQLTANSSGRFAFSLLMTRSADWRVRWAGGSGLDQGLAPFDVTVVPRVSFTLSRTKVVHGAKFVASGFVYPVRPVWIQRDTSTGWVDYLRVPGTKSRFSVTLRATLATGMQHLRLSVPTDSAHTLAAAASASRALFVYDVIVIKP